MSGPMKLDKYSRPYWRCYMCGFSVFLRTDAAEAGFRLIQSIIAKNPKRYRLAVMAIIAKKVKAQAAKGQKATGVTVKVDPAIHTPI